MPDEKRTEEITTTDGDTFDVTFNITDDALKMQQAARSMSINEARSLLHGYVRNRFTKQVDDALHAYTSLRSGEEWRTTIKLEYSFYTLGIGADLDIAAASSYTEIADIIERRVRAGYQEGWDNNALPIEWGVILRSHLYGYGMYGGVSADTRYNPPGQADPDPHQIAEPSGDEDTPSPWSIRYKQLDFLDYFTQPTVIATGEPLDWHTLDMVTPYQEVDKWLDYTPAVLQQYAPIQTIVRLLREEDER